MGRSKFKNQKIWWKCKQNISKTKKKKKAGKQTYKFYKCRGWREAKKEKRERRQRKEWGREREWEAKQGGIIIQNLDSE